MKKNIFIEKAVAVHGNVYDYSKVSDEIGNKHKVTIICKVHGEFSQRWDSHIDGCGCKRCGDKSTSNKLVASQKEYIQKAKSLRGDKFSYDKVVYNGSYSKIIVTCKIHGDFTVSAHAHINPSTKGGCKICAKEAQKASVSKGLTHQLSRAKDVHGDKYDYTDAVSGDCTNKVKIICRKHGPFLQSWNHHNSMQQGCPDCAVDDLKIGVDDVLLRATETHKGKYTYIKESFRGYTEKMDIICTKHGTFSQTVSDHLSGKGCPSCGHQISKPEQEITDFIKSIYGGDLILRDKSTGKEHDIYIPDKKIAIEFDGNYWHSDKFKTINYHKEKQENAIKHGIKLIQIFEDEWIEKQDIVKSIISSSIGATKQIFARKTTVKRVSSCEANVFFSKNHIQGWIPAKYTFGLYIDDLAVMMISFGKKRAILKAKSEESSYEIYRMASLLNHRIIGGASKLLSYFIKNYAPTNIETFSDMRYGNGMVYKTIGFTEIGWTVPNYYYTLKNKRYGRHRFQKHLLIKDGFDSSKSESDIMYERGFRKIFDSGSKKYKLTTNLNNEQKETKNV